MRPSPWGLLRVLPLLLCGFAIVAASNAAAAADAPNPTTSPTTRDARILAYCGGMIRLDRVDWIERYKKTIADIAAVGGDTVAFLLDVRMENGRSNSLWIDIRRTPSPQQLGELIDHAKGMHLRVALVPAIRLEDPHGLEWRGTISPADWETWFDNYRAMLSHFAWIAQAHKVDLLSIGAQLVSSEEKTDQWLQTIAETRQVFRGQLTYTANFDHLHWIEFWDQLDLVGMNAFWNLGDNADVTLPEIKRNWQRIHDDLAAQPSLRGKPMIFMEAGWCSLQNAAHEPRDYTKTDLPVDLDLQKRLYQAFFETWYGEPTLGGIIIYEWSPDASGPADKGYTPKGKPAEAIVREWFSKPRWPVTATHPK